MTTPVQDPLEHSLLHTVLVNSNRLQNIPPLFVALFMLVDAGVVARTWGVGSNAGWATLTFLAYAALNWVLLWALPRAGRSFGPDRPSALALAALGMVVAAAFGLFGAVWWISAAVLFGITLVVFYATWIEPFRLGVTRQSYHTAKWRADAPPLRVLHVGDLHIERLTQREREVNRLIADLKPDLIVYTGDFANLSNVHDPVTETVIRQVIGAWHAPLGVYVVAGTPLIDQPERMTAYVRGLDNLRRLDDEWAQVQTPAGGLAILGLTVTHDMARDREKLRRMMQTAPEAGALRLLLMHPPDIAPEANAAGIDLYFCGHTHGGQIRLPLIGALLSSSYLGRRFVMGRYELGTTTLYTMRGLGMEGLGAPRARLLCPPEMVLWEISGTG